ncbi:MAG: hypothetical protein ACYC33_11265 [Thermoleophilia bacterium]
MGETRPYTVLLSGPLSGCNERQRRLWRDEFKRSCRRAETIDPSEWGDEWDFTRDLAAISVCDVLVANMWKESIGTTLEVMHARSRGKPVVLIDSNHLEHNILRGLIAPEKPVGTVKEGLGERRLYRPLWSGEILEEMVRSYLARPSRPHRRKAGSDGRSHA